MPDAIERTATRLLLEYALEPRGADAPLAATLSLKDDLAIDSLSLVSAVVRLGDELGVADLERYGAIIARVRTVGDFVALGRALADPSLLAPS